MQARLLPVVLFAALLSMALVQVQLRGVGNPLLFPSMTPGIVPSSVDSASAPLSSGCGNYPPTQVKHRIAAPLRVPRLVVPPLTLTLTTRKPMYARMSPLQTGIPISVQEL